MFLNQMESPASLPVVSESQLASLQGWERDLATEST